MKAEKADTFSSQRRRRAGSASTRRADSPKNVERALARVDRLTWKELELFLAVAEAGSIRSGAERAGCAINTARRRFTRVEDVIGLKLADRDSEGLRMTPLGDNLLTIVRKMQQTRRQATASDIARGDKSILRIAVTEGLGTFWLVPRLVEFQAAQPELKVELICDMRRVDLSERAFDIAVQLERPTAGDMTTLRLGTLHLMPFAAERYLSAMGVPQTVDDWPRHRLVWQEADQVASQLLPFHIGTEDTGQLIGLTTNSSSAHFRAIATGGGIGFLPTYAKAISRKVRPLDIGVNLKREILCVVEAERAQEPAIERGIAWLKAAFDGEDFPWFSDEFQHPARFEPAISSGNVIHLFEGYIDPEDSG